MYKIYSSAQLCSYSQPEELYCSFITVQMCLCSNTNTSSLKICFFSPNGEPDRYLQIFEHEMYCRKKHSLPSKLVTFIGSLYSDSGEYDFKKTISNRVEIRCTMSI